MTKQHTTTRHRPAHGQAAFSLLELMAAIAIFTIVMVLLASIASHVQDSFRFVKDKSSRFRAARTAFESMKSTLAQATLNPYWDYDNTAEPLERIAYLPGSVVMNSSAQLSPLLNDSSLDKVFNTGDPQIRLPNIDLNYTAKAIQFRADGSANLRDGDNFLAIHRTPAGTEQEQASLDTIPDFAVFQINPVNGTFRVYRP